MCTCENTTLLTPICQNVPSSLVKTTIKAGNIMKSSLNFNVMIQDMGGELVMYCDIDSSHVESVDFLLPTRRKLVKEALEFVEDTTFVHLF